MVFHPNHVRNYRQPNHNVYPPQYPPQQMYWQQPIQQQAQAPLQQRPQQQGFNGGNLAQAQGFQQPQPPQPPKPKSSFMNAFKNEEGKFDFEKTSTTIDQVMKVGNQISPIVKSVGSIFGTKK
ncbi:YppG family protein [Evansella cellulosilytica]|uniref:YppG-like protein n=1 Tax=Evansella cellulosilytica (strain ATCC 21833 / DSM 2522 / FERM P-1141 / JCM 9156 / N-4) TaxID=649639 RepID=E6TVC6_EVAC2|nr:YppG family protein [Evansella cellulosilytica]ADU30943.1 hypothetical protein Bcell_2688 [Evansella cellulosilytica DSM 2522]